VNNLLTLAFALPNFLEEYDIGNHKGNNAYLKHNMANSLEENKLRLSFRFYPQLGGYNKLHLPLPSSPPTSYQGVLKVHNHNFDITMVLKNQRISSDV
jgi:hypothetical protein